MELKTKNILLVGGTIAMSAFALAFSRPATGEAYGGSDDQACAAITKIDPGYKPWFAPMWEPPSDEIESSLFGLQAAVGAGFLCYALGYWRGSRNVPAKTDA
ncbi:MAG: energy-coupling factor ABC transporter substrate-binding protein [Fibrobacterota bacterium]